jgi:hypothetical protein
MHLAKSIGWLFLGLGLLVTSLGCGSRYGGTPTVYAARGTVTLPNGQPARGAYVRFFPASEGAVEAEAELDDEGGFILKSIGEKEGAVPGSYKVCIDPASPSPRAAAATSAGKASIPRVYWSSDSTPITIEVRPERNEFKIQLKS